MSDELKFTLCNILSIVELQAKQTKNPIDDIIVKGLKAMLNCPAKNQTPRPAPTPNMN